MVKNCYYCNLGIFEFLLDLDKSGQEDDFVFLEVNFCFQVEYIVIEEVFGFDLVQIQIELVVGCILMSLLLIQVDILLFRGYVV